MRIACKTGSRAIIYRSGSLFLNRLAYISSMKSGSGSFHSSCLLGAYEPNFFGFRPSSFAIRICPSMSLYRFFASLHASSFDEVFLFFDIWTSYQDLNSESSRYIISQGMKRREYLPAMPCIPRNISGIYLTSEKFEC